MTDDTARRERPDFGPERGRNLVYVGRNTTIADVVKHIDEQDAEIAALREVVSLQGSALREIRIRLHAAGRRPEDCYEMSILDDTIAAVRRALGETP